MNYGLISRMLGLIVLTLALAFLVCFGVGVLSPDIAAEAEAREGFLWSAAAAGALGLVLVWLGRGTSLRVFRKEALAVIGLGWLVASVVGAIPYLVILDGIGFVSAFFETASGLTTTGASIFGDVESLPRSLLFWRALSQWIGGMGVVVFFVALLGFLGAGAKILYSNEASGSTADFDEPRVQAAVFNLWLVYLALSAACTLAYWIGGMSVYDAFCHMFTTVSTGGFSTHNASMAAFDSAFLEWMGTGFMALGGCSFLLLAQVGRGRVQVVRRNTELYAYGLLVVVSVVVILPSILENNTVTGWHDAARDGAFQVVSIMTTTGFATADFNLWPTFPKVILLVLMVVGGCSGSTAGGVKVARVVMAWRVVRRSIEVEFRPRVVRRISMNGKPLEDDMVSEVLVFLVLVTVIMLLAVPVASIFEPNLSFQATISSVFACVFNVGPGFGEVGPTQNYGGLHDYTKAMLSLLMIMGRLEFFAILVLLHPSFWRRFE